MGWLYMTHTRLRKRCDIRRPSLASARVSAREAGRRTRGTEEMLAGQKAKACKRVQARVSERDSVM